MGWLSQVALHATAALALLIGPGAGAVRAQAVRQGDAGPVAVVVLIGQAADSAELRDVVAELLARQGVKPQFENGERFDSELWLAQNPADARSFAFVSVLEPERAELHFRGPRGERFLVRELELRSGLDELGRELIARVVETAVVALLHTNEGISREQAAAELASAQAAAAAASTAPAETPVAEPPPPEPASRWHALFGLRALGHYTGPDLGVRIGFGLEASVALHNPGWPRLRARLSAEGGLPQRLDEAGVEAQLVTVPLRLGIDVGTTSGLYVGLSTGFDLVHLDPDDASSDALTLTDPSTEFVPASRLELRYELPLGAHGWLALSALADLTWRTIHYDVVQGGTVRHLATPWRVQPGLALSFGVTP
jgi:hypothetical protein